MHGVTEARNNTRFRTVLNSADLVVPDGMPLVWLGRLRRHPIKRRVYGPELMETFCAQTRSRYRHFFYGGDPGVAEELAKSLQDRFEVTVAGTYTPPFRALTLEEESDIAERVREAAPDVLWVGLGTPKQEQWMYAHRGVLQVPVMLGVGAAFDLNSGKLQQAPSVDARKRSGMVISPISGAEAVVETVPRRHPRFHVECFSGASTSEEI